MIHFPPMHKITFIVGTELKEMDATLSGCEPDKVITGQLLGYPKEQILPLLGPVNSGSLHTWVNGKRYNMTNLESDGKFTLQADF